MVNFDILMIIMTIESKVNFCKLIFSNFCFHIYNHLEPITLKVYTVGDGFLYVTAVISIVFSKVVFTRCIQILYLILKTVFYVFVSM